MIKKRIRKNRFITFFLETKIWTLTLVMAIISLLLPIMFNTIINIIPIISTDFLIIGLITSNLIMGSIGLIMVYRKEAPGFDTEKPIKGIFAIINGIVICAFFYGIALVILVARVVFNIKW